MTVRLPKLKILNRPMYEHKMMKHSNLLRPILLLAILTTFNKHEIADMSSFSLKILWATFYDYGLYLHINCPFMIDLFYFILF